MFADNRQSQSCQTTNASEAISEHLRHMLRLRRTALEVPRQAGQWPRRSADNHTQDLRQRERAGP